MSDSKSPVRLNAELGALTWINRNLGEATRTKAVTCDIRTAKGITEFCKLSGLSIEFLNKLGTQSRALGCTSKYTEREKSVTQQSQPTFWLYRSVRPSWREIDGTSRHDIEEEVEEQEEQDYKQRYVFTAEWNNNSCAIDAVIVVALYTDVWRVKIDIIEPCRLSELTLPAKLLRQIVHSPWGILEQEVRNKFRDLLSRGLELTTTFGIEVGGYAAATDVMDVCFKGVPQMSWTECKVGFCCDLKERMIYGQPRRLHHLITMTKGPDKNQTLSTVISDRMQSIERSESLEPCSKQLECRHSFTIIKKMVLDRMPASLVVYAGNSEYRLQKGRAAAWRAFDTLRVKYHTRLHQERIIEYEVKCVVFFVYDGHFVTRTKLEHADEKGNEIGHHDGRRRKLVKSWWAGLEKEAAASIIVYQLIRSTNDAGQNE